MAREMRPDGSPDATGAAPAVSLARCTGYDDGVVDALRRLLEPLGGMSAFVRPGQRVALKPNLLRPTTPASAATTHPAVVAAVARLVHEAGGHALIVDSPGGPSTPVYVRTVHRMTGMAGAAEATGATLVDDLDAVQVAHPRGLLLHRVDLLRAAVEADVLINLPKLKTHGLVGLTVAVKNLFGLVPGVVKVAYHGRLQDPREFARGLVDVALVAGAGLHIVDAVVAMEGNGPSAGEPRQLGALLAGADPLAVDVVAAALAGIAPRTVVTTDVAAEAGLTTGLPEDVEVIGETIEALRAEPALRLPDTFARGARSAEWAEGGGARRRSVGGLLTEWLGRQLLLTPRATERCTGCGFCARHCPVGAIVVQGGRARVDGRRCIRCYCCHELCPELAMELARPRLGRLIARV